MARESAPHKGSQYKDYGFLLHFNTNASVRLLHDFFSLTCVLKGLETRC